MYVCIYVWRYGCIYVYIYIYTYVNIVVVPQRVLFSLSSCVPKEGLARSPVLIFCMNLMGLAQAPTPSLSSMRNIIYWGTVNLGAASVFNFICRCRILGSGVPCGLHVVKCFSATCFADRAVVKRRFSKRGEPGVFREVVGDSWPPSLRSRTPQWPNSCSSFSEAAFWSQQPD